MDPDPTDLNLHCLSKRLQIFQQTTKAFTSCEELVPKHHFWQMRNLPYDNFWGVKCVREFYSVYL